MAVKVKTKLLDDNAELPYRQHPSDTGYDLKLTCVKKIVGDVIFFGTGLSLQPSSNYYFKIVPRSSISKHGLGLANSVGIIDNQYTGEIMVPIRVFHKAQSDVLSGETRFPSGLIKLFDTKLTSMRDVANIILKKKPYLCQLILEKRQNAEFVLAEDLEETDRGEGGFGSTDSKRVWAPESLPKDTKDEE
jgi:dUTP pyrophosphatase